MIVPAAMLVLGALIAGLLPRLGSATEAAAVRFTDQAGYNAAVLSGSAVAHPAGLFTAEAARITPASLLTGSGSALGALLLAFLALYWRRLPLLRRGHDPGAGLVSPIRRFQSGVVNDYVTWIVVGVACPGAILACAIR